MYECLTKIEKKNLKIEKGIRIKFVEVITKKLTSTTTSPY